MARDALDSSILAAILPIIDNAVNEN